MPSIGVGVVAGGDQQPLDAGIARLLLGVFGLLGEIDGRALLALGRLDLGETREPLPRAALAGRRDHEIALRDAQVRMPALRQRRRAVDRVRPRMQKDALGFERALDHRTALAGIDAEPAAGRERALVLGPIAVSTT